MVEVAKDNEIYQQLYSICEKLVESMTVTIQESIINLLPSACKTVPEEIDFITLNWENLVDVINDSIAEARVLKDIF